MKQEGLKGTFDHSGSSFDSFLEEEGIRAEVEAVAVKRVLAWQIAQAMRQQRKAKSVMAKELGTSRSQLDRLLDPRNVSVSLDTIARAARVLGKKLTIQMTDAGGSASIQTRRSPAPKPRSAASSARSPVRTPSRTAKTRRQASEVS